MDTLAAYFDRLAPAWDRWKRRNAYYHDELTRLCQAIVPKGQHVLELGCATGDLLAALEPAHGVGVDLSPKMTAIASGKHPGLRFVTADLDQALPPMEGPFDYIVAVNLVGHLSDIWVTMRRVRSVMQPGTRLVVVSYNHLWEPALKLAERLGLKTPLPPQNWIPIADQANLLETAGYEIIRQGHRLLVPVWVPLLSRLVNRFVALLPGIRQLGVIEYLVARPIPRIDASPKRCSVIVPCRNEAGNIEPLIERMPPIGAGVELIFVDGNSTDGTRERIEALMAREHGRHEIRLILQGAGKGKGDAVRKGFAAATGELFMILDADLTVVPEDLPKFYQVLAEGHGELVMGSRLVYPMADQAMRFLNWIAIRGFSALFSWLLEQRITDTLCGTKALHRDDYARIVANRAFFGDFDPFGDFDLIFGAARLNRKIVELPIRYQERTYGTTKISRFRHGWLLLRMCGVALRKLTF